jgi:CHAT domain-containing protein/tetratricopeptide (TPR) repeat protein
VVPSLLGFVLIISPWASRTADEVQPKGRSPELTAEQRAKLTERDGLVREAEELRGQGKYAEALERATRALSLTRQVHGDESPEAAEDLARVAELHELGGDFKRAVQTRQQVLALQTKLDGENHWRTSDARRALAFAEKLAGLKEEQRAKVVGALRKEQEALRLGRQGKHAEAERKATEVLETFQALSWQDSAEAARVWHLLGRARAGRQDARGVKEAIERAVGMQRAVLEKVHPDLALNLYILGNLQENLREYEAAKQSHEEALAIRRKALPQDHPAIATSLNALGLVQGKLREYAAAKKSHEEALAIYRKTLPQNHPYIAENLYNLGLVQANLREYAAAKKGFEEALAIFRKALPKDHPNIADSLNNLGEAQFDLREYAAAKKSHEEALAIRRKALPQNHPAIVDSLSNLGAVQFDLREYAAAKKSQEEALAIRRKALPQDHPDIADSLNNLGLVQESLREYAAAKKRYKEALAIRRKALPQNHPDIAESLNNLGRVQAHLREFAAAKESHEEALAICRKALPEDHPDIAKSLTNLGAVQWDLREYAAAKKRLDEALTIFRKILPKDHPNIAYSLNNLGGVQCLLHEYAAAKESYEEALAIRRKALPQDHPGIATSLNNLGALSNLSGIDLGNAVSRLAEATDLFHTDQSHLAVAQAEQEQFTTAATTSSCLDHLLSASLATDAQPNQLYTRVVRVKGSVTTQQRWARQLRDAKDPETARLLRQLRDLTRQLTGLSVADPTAGPSSRHQDMVALIQSLSEERAALERQLSARSAVYRALQAQALLGADDIRAALGRSDNVALVDFVDYLHYSAPSQGEREPSEERRLIAFVVRPGQKSVTLVPLGSSQLLAERIDRWRASYGAGKAPPEGASDPAAELRKHLWEPLEKHLKGVKVVLVSPDGPLHGLPLAALPGAKEGTFLIHEYAFATVPIPQLLPDRSRNDHGRSADPTSLVVGDIDFNAGPDTTESKQDYHFLPLPGTKAEAKSIHDLFLRAFNDRPSELLTGKEATKEAFVHRAPQCSYLLVATHGFFLPEPEQKEPPDLEGGRSLRMLRLRPDVVTANPALRSGLAFAGANREAVGRGTSFLTAFEASELDLRRVDLAVLSACETGRGQVRSGEGVLGLQRAFQLAGARTAVTSLWKVDDLATQALMTRFHSNLWEKRMGKLEALREAQLWLVNEGWKHPELNLHRGLVRPVVELKKGDAVSPFYWAAFVLSGDWR